MKLRAQQMGSMKALRESLKKGGAVGGDTWIKNIPADGITVRFLTEPEDWFGYQEYWDDANKAFVPMAEGEVTPDGVRPSFRYLANALDVETDRVVALKLPKTAANVLILKYDKYDTMMDRNYELQKHGEGIDTTYDVTPDGPSKMNLGKYELHDLYDVLVNARERAIGERDIDAPAGGASSKAVPKGKPTKATPAPVANDDDDDIDTDDDADETAHDYSPFTEETLFPNGTILPRYTAEQLAVMTEDDHVLIADEWLLSYGNGAVLEALLAHIDSDDDADADADGADDDDDDDDDAAVELDDLLTLDLRSLRVMASNLGIEFRKMTKEQLAEVIYAQS